MIKSKIFKSEFVDIKLEVMETGWIILYDGERSIALGKPENARIDLIEDAIKYARKIK